jgi:acetate kinase
MNIPQALLCTVNAGSSSVKLALFEAAQGLVKLGSCELGRAGRTDMETGSAAVAWVEAQLQGRALRAVAHRLVQGGPRHSADRLIDGALLSDLKGLTDFDPEHLPAEIYLIETFQRRFAGIPQVSCFDTAFHQDMPQVARVLAIPRKFQALGLRRYGFHGLSYTFLLAELARQAGKDAALGKVVLAHLGHGASLAALSLGKPVDTSMGFSPASGIPMGTRSGDLDPGIALFLEKAQGMDARGFNHMVNAQSGLLGISETTSDMRELLAREPEDPRAAEAVALFCYQAKKFLGAYAAALGGLDTLVFSGGIGEHAPQIRQRICAGLGFLGLELDEPANTQNAPVISSPASRVTVRVIATDEERVMAGACCRILNLPCLEA